MNPPETERNTAAASKKKADPSFDPFELGIVCADSWWDLGRLLAHRSDTSWIQRQMPGWLKDVRPVFRDLVTLTQVQAFANTVYDLLSRKYVGEDIAEDVEALLAPGRLQPANPPGNLFTDDGAYLRLNESWELFWSIEFELLFRDLQRTETEGDDDWLSVVSTCPQCGTFFVKQRKDQVFDTTVCRNKFANKYVPRSRRWSRRH